MQTTQIGEATLLLGDAFDILPGLDPVDVVITDPPYGSQTREGARTAFANRPAPLIDFDSIAEDQFIAFCAHAVVLARRWVIMSCEWRYVASLERAGLPMVGFGIWHKVGGF